MKESTFALLILVSGLSIIAIAGCSPGSVNDGDFCDDIDVGSACTGFCDNEGRWDCVGGVAQCRITHVRPEVCGDGVDNNCNGSTDEGCSASCTPVTEICGNTRDDDCDGLVDEDCSTCVPQSEEEEICDDLDDDCDGDIDEGCDDDHDDYCDSGMTVASGGCGMCPHSPPGQGDDCDDMNPDINPGADEICDDGVDNDCDGLIDEGCDTCTPTEEVCNGRDDDCDGLEDEGGVCGPTCGEGALLGTRICLEWPSGFTPMTTYGGATMTSPRPALFDCGGDLDSVRPGESACATLTEACEGWLMGSASQGSFDDVNNIASFFTPSGSSLAGLTHTDIGLRIYYFDSTGARHDLPSDKAWVANDPSGVTVPSAASTHVGERVLRIGIPVREDCLATGMRPPDRW